MVSFCLFSITFWEGEGAKNDTAEYWIRFE